MTRTPTRFLATVARISSSIETPATNRLEILCPTAECSATERMPALCDSVLNKDRNIAQCPVISRYRSTSMAAMQPVPEAVIACR